ncbi:octopamine receptor-like [Schistocerca americana]|uniref:octopamine receptor-like n=1 Tax=Schistocerca americana TaxID=7009 RepID=UPI001F4FC7A6|nr:octopamine receptor-like [Schistocerca americana]
MGAGNTLIIAAVVTTRRLRTVTNCFVMSLAVADWLVGLFVMPLAVAYHVMGKWHFGWQICQVWISLDVLLCTASILSLCAISVDRYLAVTQPLNYSRRRRSKKLALLMILVVWVLAVAITCPPILGWSVSQPPPAARCSRHYAKTPLLPVRIHLHKHSPNAATPRGSPWAYALRRGEAGGGGPVNIRWRAPHNSGKQPAHR